jgi:hypothetical protein
MSSTNGFPFQATRRFVLSKIESHDSVFVIAALRLVDERCGWMASHKVRAAKVLAKIAADNLSSDDLAEAAALARPYARTISRILRERELAERPELLGQAALFGVHRPTVVAPVETAPLVAVAPAPVVDTTAEPATLPKKRRGRPPGSKTRPREERETKPRRRRA